MATRKNLKIKHEKELEAFKKSFNVLQSKHLALKKQIVESDRKKFKDGKFPVPLTDAEKKAKEAKKAKDEATVKRQMAKDEAEEKARQKKLAEAKKKKPAPKKKSPPKRKLSINRRKSRIKK